MIKISKKSQYGLRAMIFLAKNYKKGNIVSVKEISKKEGIPFDFLEKIISGLEKAGLVSGKKGVLGGYALSKSPKKLNVNEIVFALEGRNKPVDCALCGRSGKCISKSVWVKLDIALNKTLSSITLAKLIK